MTVFKQLVTPDNPAAAAMAARTTGVGANCELLDPDRELGLVHFRRDVPKSAVHKVDQGAFAITVGAASPPAGGRFDRDPVPAAGINRKNAATMLSP